PDALTINAPGDWGALAQSRPPTSNSKQVMASGSQARRLRRALESSEGSASRCAASKAPAPCSTKSGESCADVRGTLESEAVAFRTPRFAELPVALAAVAASSADEESAPGVGSLADSCAAGSRMCPVSAPGLLGGALRRP